MIDAADDDRVTRLHAHLVGVGEEVDFSAHAAEAVQGVGAVPLDLVMDPPLRVGETIDFTMEGVFPKYRYATAAKLREATRGTAIGERPFDYIAWMIECPTRLLKITIDLPKDAGIELLGPLSSYHDYDFPITAGPVADLHEEYSCSEVVESGTSYMRMQLTVKEAKRDCHYRLAWRLP